jgi:hypothetical protein
VQMLGIERLQYGQLLMVHLLFHPYNGKVLHQNIL